MWSNSEGRLVGKMQMMDREVYVTQISFLKRSHTYNNWYLLFMNLHLPLGGSSQLSIEFYGVFHPLISLLPNFPQILWIKLLPSLSSLLVFEWDKQATHSRFSSPCSFHSAYLPKSGICLSCFTAQLSAWHNNMWLQVKQEALENTEHIWNSFAVRVKFLPKYHIQQEQYSWKSFSIWYWRSCSAI